jgi:hypothetical protein
MKICNQERNAGRSLWQIGGLRPNTDNQDPCADEPDRKKKAAGCANAKISAAHKLQF